MTTALVTGGAGFFGGVLAQRLLDDGLDVISVDLQPDERSHPRYTAIRGDIRDAATMARACAATPHVVYHCAAMLAHDAKDHTLLWTSNVDGTRTVAQAASEAGCRKFVYISSNCLWGVEIDHPIDVNEPPNPGEIYGRSKLEGERLLADFPALTPVIIRTPTIIDEGRLGLLTILFDFIDEGRRVWLVGRGDNRYQFIYAPDLADACVRAAGTETAATFHVGSDDVPTLRETYEYVIAAAGTGARVASMPRWLAVPGMAVASRLGLSPLGPYHWRMIAANFLFDTGRAKTALGWRPTLGNAEVLAKAYAYYHVHRDEINARTDASAHRRSAKMGIIKLLKAVS